jgi:hypothetical protein
MRWGRPTQQAESRTRLKREAQEAPRGRGRWTWSSSKGSAQGHKGNMHKNDMKPRAVPSLPRGWISHILLHYSIHNKSSYPSGTRYSVEASVCYVLDLIHHTSPSQRRPLIGVYALPELFNRRASAFFCNATRRLGSLVPPPSGTQTASQGGGAA